MRTDALPISNRDSTHPGLKAFTILLIGQTISLLGTSLTGFGLGVWAYQKAGSVTDFAMIALAASVPAAILSPFAGTIVDHFNRKTLLLIGQSVAVLLTLAQMTLFWLDILQVWHIVVLTGLAAVFNAFVMPAITSSITMMVDTKELPKANGMLSLSVGIVQLIAPALAGALLLSIGLKGIFLIDLTTFVFGVFALIITSIPQPTLRSESRTNNKNLLESTLFGWKYLKQRKGMTGLLLLHTALAFNVAAIGMLITPMVLGFTDAAGLGMIASVSGSGMILGSLIVVTWGGPKRKMLGVYGGAFFVALGFILTPIVPSTTFVALGGCLIMTAFPIATACNQEIFQRKIASDIQGRVFGLRSFTVGIVTPVALLLAGPLADQLFEPNMASNGLWATTLGQIYGTGSGRGIAVMISAMGVASLLLVLVAIAARNMRRIDIELPDLNLREPVVSSDREVSSDRA